MDRYFSIKSGEDVYFAIGKIIEASQDLEQAFKTYVDLLGIDVPNLETSTLNKLNDKLHKEKKFSDDLYNNLKTVISMRNFINHEFFLNRNNNYQMLNKELHKVLNYIFEANDVISNKIDELKGINIKRPTIYND